MGGLAIYKAEKQDDGGLVADRKLYLTREGPAGQRIVEYGDADAGYLLATPGSVIPADQVKAYNLEVKDGKVQQAKASDSSPPAVAVASFDQETGPALKKAAEEKRKTDLHKTQTDVAVLEPPPGHEEGVKRRDAVVAAAAEEVAATAGPVAPVAPVRVAGARTTAAAKTGVARPASVTKTTASRTPSARSGAARKSGK